MAGPRATLTDWLMFPPRAILFVCTLVGSGVPLLLAQVTVLLLPLGRRRRSNTMGRIMSASMACVVWIGEHLGGSTVRLHFESAETEEASRREDSVWVANHTTGVDWIYGSLGLSRLDRLHGLKAIIKEELFFSPVLGLLWWLGGYCFLRGKWEKDQGTLAKSCARWADAAHNVTIFPEGTRFTAFKHDKFWKKTAASGSKLTERKHLLPPRARGFSALRAGLPTTPVYTCTMCYSEPGVSLCDLFLLRPLQLDIIVRRHEPADVPRDEAGCEVWLDSVWEVLDADLERFKSKRAMPEGFKESTLAKRAWILWLTRTYWAVGVVGLGHWLRTCPVLPWRALGIVTLLIVSVTAVFAAKAFKATNVNLSRGNAGASKCS
mmetsp:Transcript_27731/g.94661  ORF Transcript_27731/g.94661 Transcript_27731/m.94661 type:complete len:378 (-) Transcript_27731:605-1738(-)